MAKNPFKKDSIIDTAINVGTGGAANALVDMAVNSVFPNVDPMYVNIGKFAGGVILGSIAGKNQMLRAAVDGVATVGVSNLISNLVADGFGSDSGSEEGEGASGFKRDVLGRVRSGHSRLARRIKMRGVGNAANPIMG